MRLGKVEFWWEAVIAVGRGSTQLIAMRMTVAAFVLLLSVGACGTGERPFRMVQFCLANSGEIDAMKSVLQNVAATNKLPFYDNSKQTETDLTSIAERQKNTPVAHPVVNVGTVGPTAMGFSAANFPDVPSQIVIGFSKADDVTEARKLSDAVVGALSKRWHVHEVPHVATSGAFPLKDCGR